MNPSSHQQIMGVDKQRSVLLDFYWKLAKSIKKVYTLGKSVVKIFRKWYSWALGNQWRGNPDDDSYTVHQHIFM